MLVLFDNHREDARYTGPCDASPTITSHLGTGGLNAPLVATDWRVRMITPLECARLQGFPDWWTDGLTDSEPSDAEVRKWQGIFDEYCDLTGKKRKTASQIRKWLMTEPTDAAKYKMWGNGVALPCVVFVLAGIVWEVNSANK